MNDLINLQKWCDAYKERTSMKVHPQAAPTDILIDEILGSIEGLRNYYNNLVSIYNGINERVNKLETEFIETNKQLLEAITLINTVLDAKENKKVKK